jgi:hypothetical protein
MAGKNNYILFLFFLLFSCSQEEKRQVFKDSLNAADNKNSIRIKDSLRVVEQVKIAKNKTADVTETPHHPDNSTPIIPGNYVKYHSPYKFSDFKVDTLYFGKPHHFECPINGYVWQKTISEKDEEFLRTGMNFAGHYSVFYNDCGCMCQTITIVDLLTGKVYDDFPFGKVDGNYGLDIRKYSRLLIANSGLLDNYPGYREIQGDRKPEYYVWNDSAFTRLK